MLIKNQKGEKDMARKRRNGTTKSKIVAAAWRLFYEQGYDDTTVEEIIAESGTSRGSFYHYFEGKDALLSSLSYLFDEKYEEILEKISKKDRGLKNLCLFYILFCLISAFSAQKYNAGIWSRLWRSLIYRRGRSWW